MSKSKLPLRIDVEDEGDNAVVHLRGAADMDQADALQDRMVALAKERRPIVVLDLSELEFIGSPGLAAIVHGYVKSRHHNGRFRLLNPAATIREVFERTRLTCLFPVCTSLDEAMRD
jgi:anti-anti-sigma factor